MQEFAVVANTTLTSLVTKTQGKSAGNVASSYKVAIKRLAFAIIAFQKDMQNERLNYE